MTDTQLLQKYVQHGDEQAFAQLVRMHVDVVYSAARRQAKGDASRAEDITQQVFILLAQRAKTLSDDVLIAGWLYNAARFVARDETRKEQRRAQHERKAAAMADELRKASAPAKTDAWSDAEQILDEAMEHLDEPTRGLLVLRYFQGRSAGDVAQRLGISEDAARKRISRGVEQLRGMFARRGVVMSATLLAEALAANAIINAPAHLAASTASAATSVATATSAGAAVTTGAVIMAASKAKIVAASLLGLLAVGGVVTGGVKAVQYFAAPSGPRTVRVAPAPPEGSTISGIIRDPSGAPLSGAEIFIAGGGPRLNILQRGRLRPVTTTAGDGRYSVAVPAGAYELVVRSPQGYAQVSDQTLKQSTEVAIGPWGSVSGQVLVGDKPMANVLVHTFEGSQPLGYGNVMRQAQTRTDAQGRFRFDRVPPGELWIYHDDAEGQRARYGYAVVDPGKAATVTIGGSGRAIVGRLVNPPTTQLVWSRKHRIYSYDTWLRPENILPVGRPKHDLNEPPETVRAKEEAFGRTPVGARFKAWQFGWNFSVNADGSFRVDDVPPGMYEVYTRVLQTDPEISFSSGIATGRATILLPPANGAPDDQPVEIGSIPMIPDASLGPGDVATPFAFKTLDGKTHNVSDYRGKYLMLIWWRTEAGFKRDVKEFEKIHAKLEDHPRLKMLWLCFLDTNIADKTARDWEIPGEIATAELKGIPEEYQVCPVTACLIDPEGKVVKKFIMGEPGEKYLVKRLGKTQ